MLKYGLPGAFYTTRDIAARYNVSIKTVGLWCREGRFPGAFQVNIRSGLGRAWLVPAGDLEGFEKPGAPGVGRPPKAATAET